MKEAICISIQNPCSEKFGTFNSTKSGGYCTLCQKEVIDFTAMSYAQITRKIGRENQNVCGRFSKKQLSPSVAVVGAIGKKNLWSAPIGFCFSLLTLGAFGGVRASDDPSLVCTEYVQFHRAGNNGITPNHFYKTYMVRGKVIDDEGLPLPGVSIVLKGTDIGVSTDLEGEFEFPTPLEAGDILVFNYLGYDTKSYKVKESEDNTINITIKFESSDIELMGEVAVEGVYKTKRNIFQKFISLFR